MSASIKSVLITHAPPADDNSPYANLTDDWGIQFDFANLIKIQGIPTPEFRKQSINPLDFSAVIFTSKISVDNFFRICKDLRVEMPADTKYFCVNNATAKYLQKYITIRKRKLFTGERVARDLIDVVKKHANEKFLMPTSQGGSTELTRYMEEHGFNLKEAFVYETVFVDIQQMNIPGYDMLCFFSPVTIEAFFHNFPSYQQGEQRIAVFGRTTAQAAEDRGLAISVRVPQPDMPSMTMGIEAYLKEQRAA